MSNYYSSRAAETRSLSDWPPLRGSGPEPGSYDSRPPMGPLGGLGSLGCASPDGSLGCAGAPAGAGLKSIEPMGTYAVYDIQKARDMVHGVTRSSISGVGGLPVLSNMERTGLKVALLAAAGWYFWLRKPKRGRAR